MRQLSSGQLSVQKGNRKDGLEAYQVLGNAMTWVRLAHLGWLIRGHPGSADRDQEGG